MSSLTQTQQIILECAASAPGQFTRSGLAKLLAGSKSERLGDVADHPFYGRFRDRSRKQIVYDVDVLLQQQYLALDPWQRVIPGPKQPRPEGFI